MAVTSFAKPFNNVATTVAAGGYTAGSGTLNVVSTSGMSLSAGQWLRVSTFHAGVPVAILRVTSIAGTALTVSGAVDGTVDGSLSAGDPVEMRITAGAFSDIATAVNNLESTISVARTICQGRMTLQSGGPLSDGSLTGNSTLYFTPFRGGLIGLYDGSTQWNILSFSETSIAIPPTVGPFDLFAYNNSGTMALEFSTVWTQSGDGTGVNGTRADALTTQDGIYVKSGAPTRRYLGTIYSAGSTCYDMPGAVGWLGKRYVWNYYNRVRKPIKTIDSAVSWSYGTNAWRAFNNNANNLSSIKVVTGLSEDLIECTLAASANDQSNNTYYGIAVGYDSFTSPASSYAFRTAVADKLNGYVFAFYNVLELYGLHTLWALENCLGLINVYANGAGSEIHAVHWC